MSKTIKSVLNGIIGEYQFVIETVQVHEDIVFRGRIWNVRVGHSENSTTLYAPTIEDICIQVVKKIWSMPDVEQNNGLIFL